MTELGRDRWTFASAVKTGEATISNGTTSTNVTHNLGTTPTDGDIILTPTSDLGSATKFYISAYTATTFTITVDGDPGADITFAYRAEIIN